MRKMNTTLTLLAAAVLFMPVFCYAADVTEEEVSPRTKKIYLEPEKSALERGKARFLTAFTVGFDDNAHLDSNRDGDAYMQEFVRGSWTSDASQKTVATFEAEMMNLMYAGQSDLDLCRAGFRAGVDHSLNQNFTVSLGYNIDVIDYINTGTEDYYENALSAKITQRFSNKVFQSFMYTPSYRNYNKRYTRTPAGIYSRDKKREDFRNTVDYEIGKFFTKDLVKLNFQYYNNNSNETYLNYYDYNAYRVGTSLTHLFNDKFSGYMGLSNLYRFYKTRTLINNNGSHQRDMTFLMTSSLFYTASRSLAFGLSYSYRQNYSNEPAERYSGSLVSLSTYYKF
jgi:hypothetical protein